MSWRRARKQARGDVDGSSTGRRNAKAQQIAEDRQLDKDCSPCKDFDSEAKTIASLPTET